MGKEALKRVDAKFICQLTNGLFSTIVDTTLFWLLLLPISSIGKKGSIMNAFKMAEDVDYLKDRINFTQFKNAYKNLKSRGLINSIKSWLGEKVATTSGIKKLKGILPFYDERREWDGYLYVIQYDIPINQNRLRDQLRDWFLKKLGTIQLQHSAYVLFSNPRILIKNFTDQLDSFGGSILVSRLLPDGFLSEADLKDFLWSRSGLDNLNEEYRQFIDKYKKEIKGPDIARVCFNYFSILQRDPQIPFALLPDYYLGDEAYLLFLKLVKNSLLAKYVLG